MSKDRAFLGFIVFLRCATIDCSAPSDGTAHYAGTFILSVPGLFVSIVSAILLTYAFAAAFTSISSWDFNEDNITVFLIENLEKIRNGKYDYTNSKTYPVISTAAIDPWLQRMKHGMRRYNFGRSVDNFCWKRDFTTGELPSIFRATQLSANIQVSIRTIILTSLTYRLFLLFSSLYELSIYSFVTVGTPTIFLALLNEVLLTLSFFTTFTIHVWQDERYRVFSLMRMMQLYQSSIAAMYKKVTEEISQRFRLFFVTYESIIMFISYMISHLIYIAITSALISYAVKMAVLIAVKKKGITSAVRIIFIVTTILISQTIMENVRSFNEYVFCDQLVPKSVAYAESLLLIMDFITSFFDVYDAQSLMFFIYCDSEDYRSYDDSL